MTNAVPKVELVELVETLSRWRPPDRVRNETPIPLFTPVGLIGQPVSDALIEGPGWPEHRFIQLLDLARPIGYDAAHRPVPRIDDPNDEDLGILRELVDSFAPAVGRHALAVGIRRALPDYLASSWGGAEEDAEADPQLVFRALRRTFLMAELAWALGLDAKHDTIAPPVAVASVEACSAIAGVLLRHWPDPSALVAGWSVQGLGGDLLLRLHHARMAWIDVLLHFDDHADLVADGGVRLNERLRLLVGRTVTGRGGSGADERPSRLGRRIVARLTRPFGLFRVDPVPVASVHLDAGRVEEPAERTESIHPALGRADDQAVDAVRTEEEHRFLEVAARLLLPRYLIDEAIGLLQDLGHRDAPARAARSRSQWAWPLIVAAVAGVILMLLAVTFAVVGVMESRFVPRPVPAPDWVRPAATWVQGVLLGLAFAWGMLATCELWQRGRGASYALLLRVPAATSFGLAILFGLDAGWLGGQRGIGRFGSAIALIAAFAYAYVEFINQGGRHGRRRREQVATSGGTLSAARAALNVTILSSGLAVIVSSVVFWVFGGTFLPGVDVLLADPVDRLEVLVILSSVSLALGTFLQAIWDEQPITAPLSHLRLRG